MQSPITGKKMKLVKEPGMKLSFRKEEFPVTYHYYLCEDSGEQFTTEDLDRINLTQVYNKYREKFGVPFPEEIRAIREKYGVSASKMSEILGFGTNSYRLYENGEIPSVANGRLILAVKHPKDFIKQVEASKHLLTEKEAKKFIDQADELMSEEKDTLWEFLLAKHIFIFESANEFSGYRKPHYEKIANVIAYFSERIKDLFKTKLNKLLFYADFAFFRLTGFSMTGITYKAIQFGPVPAEYGMLYEKLQDDGDIEIHQVPNSDGNYNEVIKSISGFNRDLFTEEEIETLNLVVDRLGKLRSKDIVERSHEEKAWVENNENKELISYPRYAFDLVTI